MISVSVKKSYGNKVVLDVLELAFEEGKHYALVGANGSGKSTLLKILGGLEKADKSADTGLNEVKDKNVCYMPQNSYAFSMSLKRNVFLACPDVPRMKDGDMRVFYNDRCYKLISDMGLWKLRYKNAAKLSGGEMQRMALCRTLVEEHDFLLLDEPTSAMDVAATAVAENVLKGYFEQYKPTVIFATHSIKQAERLADEIIFLHEGKVVERGKPEQLLHSPESAELKAFLQNA